MTPRDFLAEALAGALFVAAWLGWWIALPA